MAADDDDLDQIPWWDAKALRMVEAIERSIVRLRLDSQGEFISIINAIEVQLESHETAPRSYGSWSNPCAPSPLLAPSRNRAGIVSINA